MLISYQSCCLVPTNHWGTEGEDYVNIISIMLPCLNLCLFFILWRLIRGFIGLIEGESEMFFLNYIHPNHVGNPYRLILHLYEMN